MHGRRLKGSIKKQRVRARLTIAIYSIMAQTQKHINFILLNIFRLRVFRCARCWLRCLCTMLTAGQTMMEKPQNRYFIVNNHRIAQRLWFLSIKIKKLHCWTLLMQSRTRLWRLARVLMDDKSDFWYKFLIKKLQCEITFFCCLRASYLNFPSRKEPGKLN